MSYFIETIPTGPETDVTVTVPDDWRIPILAIRHKEQTLTAALDVLEVRMLILALQLAAQEAEQFP